VHAVVDPPPVLAQLHDAADVLGRRHDPRLHVGLLDAVDLGRVGEIARVLEDQERAVGAVHVILHRRHGRDEIEVELALQPLLHDLHVEQTEEAAAEAEAERGGRLGLVVERRVVERELLQRVPERLVLLRIGGVEPGEHHGLHVAIAGQQLGRAVVGIEDGVAHAGVAHVPEARDQVANLARLEQVGRVLAQLEVADFVDVIDVVGVRPERDLHAFADHAVDHTDAGDAAAILVVVRVEDERPERRLFLAARRRHPVHDRLEQGGDAGPLLGGHGQDLFPLGADQVHDLLGPALGFGAGEVDLVEHREDFEPGVHGEEEIGEGLRLDALRGVDHEDRALACRERAGDLVSEVHVPGRVDQVQLVVDAVARGVAHPHRVQLDRDPALALEIHRVEQLLPHQALLDGVGRLDETIRQRRLAVIDVGDDAEVADAGLGHGGEYRLLLFTRADDRAPAPACA
jgi:hypothetical protein